MNGCTNDSPHCFVQGGVDPSAPPRWVVQCGAGSFAPPHCFCTEWSRSICSTPLGCACVEKAPLLHPIAFVQGGVDPSAPPHWVVQCGAGSFAPPHCFVHCGAPHGAHRHCVVQGGVDPSAPLHRVVQCGAVSFAQPHCFVQCGAAQLEHGWLYNLGNWLNHGILRIIDALWREPERLRAVTPQPSCPRDS